MKRSLDSEHVVVVCHTGHVEYVMKHVGYYALKEAGAPMTILGFECPCCHRMIFVTEEIPRPDQATLNAMDQVS